MPRIYIGPHDAVSIQHPVSGKWIDVRRNELTLELDDLDPKVHDLGPEWDIAPAGPKPPKPAPAPAPAPKDGDA